MYWKDKYDKAILDGKQLIGDKVMRNTFYNENPEAITIEEVRFPEFQADILEFIELKNKLMLVGFEFKSDRDNLDKLEVQLRGYLKYCNFVLVYATLRHRQELLQILSKPEFERVGARFYKMTSGGKCFKVHRTAKYKDLNNSGLSVDWISKKSKLYRWIYLLKEIWGGEI